MAADTQRRVRSRTRHAAAAPHRPDGGVDAGRIQRRGPRACGSREGRGRPASRPCTAPCRRCLRAAGSSAWASGTAARCSPAATQARTTITTSSATGAVGSRQPSARSSSEPGGRRIRRVRHHAPRGHALRALPRVRRRSDRRRTRLGVAHPHPRRRAARLALGQRLDAGARRGVRRRAARRAKRRAPQGAAARGRLGADARGDVERDRAARLPRQPHRDRRACCSARCSR